MITSLLRRVIRDPSRTGEGASNQAMSLRQDAHPSEAPRENSRSKPSITSHHTDVLLLGLGQQA